MSAVEHAARGTYVPCRHGPLPPGVVPARPRPVLVARGSRPVVMPVVAPVEAVSTLAASDCPDVLTPEGRAIWIGLVTQRPTDRLLVGFVTLYVEALLAWQRATAEIRRLGDYGKTNGRAGANPYLRLRTHAAADMFKAANFLGWQGQPAAPVAVEAPRSRLDLFLQARGGA